MIQKILILLLLFFSVITGNAEAQIWPFRKRSQAQRATAEYNDRKKEAGEGNLFNQLINNDPNRTDLRDDHVWSYNSAGTSYKNAGNVSVLSASRYGIFPGLELQTWLGLDYWIPNIFVKREISRGDYWISSLHGVYSSWTGLKYVEVKGGPFPADSVSGTPVVLSVRNQLIVSKPFYDVMDCNPNQPFLVLTGFIALDYGFAFTDEEIYIEEQHLITPRSRSYAGKGFYGTLGVRGDWRINPAFYIRGELRGMMGKFPSGLALEQQASVEYFPFRNFSLSGGYVVGMGRLGKSFFSLWPFVDISFYFGRKQGRNRGLFKETMF